MANTMFVPARKIITAITNANPAVVTTSTAHDYISGLIVRIDIPEETSLETHGMPQIDQEYAPISVIDDTNFSIAIDTRAYAPFVVPVPEYQYAQSVPIGEINEILAGALHNSLNPQDNI